MNIIKQWLKYSDLSAELNSIKEEFGLTNWRPHELSGETIDDYNAYAHAWMSAAIAFDKHSYTAETLGDLREARSILTDAWAHLSGGDPALPTFRGSILEGNRDLYNNEIGLQIAQYAQESNLPRSYIKYLVYDALPMQTYQIIDNGLLLSSLGDPRASTLSTSRLDYHPSARYDGPSSELLAKTPKGFLDQPRFLQ